MLLLSTAWLHLPPSMRYKLTDLTMSAASLLFLKSTLTWFPLASLIDGQFGYFRSSDHGNGLSSSRSISYVSSSMLCSCNVVSFAYHSIFSRLTQPAISPINQWYLLDLDRL